MGSIAAFLAGYPKLTYLLIAIATGALVWVWRKVAPESWIAWKEKHPRLQILPAIVLSGLISTAPAWGKPTVDFLVEIVLGIVLGGGGAVVGHHLLKASPLPYTGAVKPKSDDSRPGTPPGPPAWT